MKIQDFLTKQGVAFDALEHRPTYDAQRMAQAVHVSGHEVAKTVLVRCAPGNTYVVAVLPAAEHIDMLRLRAALDCEKVELATEIEIGEHCPDCEIGALPPFGSQYGMQTVVDESLAADESIVFEGNTHHEAIRMRFEDFRDTEQPLVASFVQP